MCRMLIALGNIETKPLLQAMITMAEDEHQAHEFNHQGFGSFKHPDGWGLAYIKKGEWIIHTSTKAIYEDPSVKKFETLKTNVLLVHVRRKSVGETSLANTQPFHENHPLLGNYVFCHNGTIANDLEYDIEFVPQGTTDSEKLFYSLISNLKDKKITDAVRRSLKEIDSLTGTNLILASPQQTIAASKTNSHPQYFQMSMGKKEDLCIISSEVIPTLSVIWHHIEPGSIILVNNKTLQFAIHKEQKAIAQKIPLLVRSF